MGEGPGNSIAIVGAGLLGGSIARVLVVEAIGDRCLLIEDDADRRRALALELAALAPAGRPTIVEADAPADLSGAALAVVGDAPGEFESPETRATANAKWMRRVLPALLEAAPSTVFCTVAEPVDGLTMLARELAIRAGRDGSAVLGRGTVRESDAFRFALAERLRVCRDSVHGEVVGEHGPTLLPLWSTARVGGTPLSRFRPGGKRSLTVQERSKIAHGVRESVGGSGNATQSHHAMTVAHAVGRICRAIVDDERAVLTVSSHHAQVGEQPVEPACFSLPTVVGRGGVTRVVEELPLNDAEAAGLAHAAATIAAAHREL